ncbi:MAG: CIA30 family protein [Planctomycetota bacterium]
MPIPSVIAAVLAIAPLQVPPEPVVLADFEAGSDLPRWTTVNDNVMGGRSTGGPRYTDGVLTFSGFTNTIGGGFSSLRSVPARFDLSEHDAIRVRVRGDARTYRVDLRTDAWYDDHEVAYQARFTPSGPDEWSEITIPFSAFFPTSKGDDVRGLVPELDPANVRRVGVIINDGIHGRFKLEIDSIEAIMMTLPDDIRALRSEQAIRLQTLRERLGV